MSTVRCYAHQPRVYSADGRTDLAEVIEKRIGDSGEQQYYVHYCECTRALEGLGSLTQSTAVSMSG